MSHRPIGRRPLLAAGVALATPALAQPRWQPDRPVRWIVAYPAGGGSDNCLSQCYVYCVSAISPNQFDYVESFCFSKIDF